MTVPFDLFLCDTTFLPVLMIFQCSNLSTYLDCTKDTKNPVSGWPQCHLTTVDIVCVHMYDVHNVGGVHTYVYSVHTVRSVRMQCTYVCSAHM